MVMEQGQRFTLRDGTLTLGTGVVTKLNQRLTEAERMLIVEGKKGREKAAASASGGKKWKVYINTTARKQQLLY